MLDFTPVREKRLTLADLTADLTPTDLHDLSNELYDTVLAIIEDCTDADVVFQPKDSAAYDPYAATEAEKQMPWRLGHVIVHLTASAEESAFLAAELARGVAWHGRSRYETPWQTVTTIGQCRQRLSESRRICLASLQLWPEQPHLDNYYQHNEDSPKVNAITRYTGGLMHADNHLGQLHEIVRQAKRARSA
ncbi:MAG: DinB family protein [Chloroflexota bacterium]|jgi:hypothetical protein